MWPNNNCTKGPESIFSKNGPNNKNSPNVSGSEAVILLNPDISTDGSGTWKQKEKKNGRCEGALNPPSPPRFPRTFFFLARLGKSETKQKTPGLKTVTRLRMTEWKGHNKERRERERGVGGFIKGHNLFFGKVGERFICLPTTFTSRDVFLFLSFPLMPGDSEKGLILTVLNAGVLRRDLKYIGGSILRSI